MQIRPDRVAEIDAFGERPDSHVFTAVWQGEIAALRIYNLVSPAACQQLTEKLLLSKKVVNHADVDGMRVIGLSHFQAVRNPSSAQHYHNEGRTTAGAL